MKVTLVLLGLSCILSVSTPKGQLPSTYEYFTQDGTKSGLSADQPGFFKLNGKDIRIISGAIHYFRVHPDYWRTSLRKLRSMGANAVETYAPWNLHEPEKGVFDFGNGGREFSAFMNVRRFVQIAKEEDLLVIFRAGPYICAEWEYGGLPSWLLRDPNMNVRTDYGPWMQAMENYLNKLLPQVADLQFVRGGSIIALQIENEYAVMWPRSIAYLQRISQVFQLNGFSQSLFFTSDNPAKYGAEGALAGVLMTANFQKNVNEELSALKKLQPNRPIMAMEYWTGWYDKWWDTKHGTFDENTFKWGLETIFKDYTGSVNLYMFQGGTNFGFMAGANNYPNYYLPTVTSYDYDALLTEAGDYTKKYYMAKDLIGKYQVPALRAPNWEPETTKAGYGTVYMEEYLNYFDIIAQVPRNLKSSVQKPIAMEELNINGGSGQSYGYIVYRNMYSSSGNKGVSLKAGPVKDLGIVIVDGAVKPDKWSYWFNKEIDTTFPLTPGRHTLDILVENTGRANIGWEQDFKYSKKGLPNGWVSVNGVALSDFEVIPLEFKSEWVSELKGWKKPGGEGGAAAGPAMFRSTFQVNGSPADTFLDMQGWHKGIVFINGFNIGRYFKAGPQKTLYVPAPLLTQGPNSIVIFEQLEPSNSVQFVAKPILG